MKKIGLLILSAIVGTIGLIWPVASHAGSLEVTGHTTPMILQPLISDTVIITAPVTSGAILTNLITIDTSSTPLNLTDSNFEITFEELGYQETVLSSPWGTVQTSFRIPDNWLVGNKSYLNLEFTFFSTGVSDEIESLGVLQVNLDNNLLYSHPLNKASIGTNRLSIELPPELFNDQANNFRQISLVFDARLLCDVPHKAQLTVNPKSSLSLRYAIAPPKLDLAAYPQPFYQQSFLPDEIRFILPEHPSEMELQAAATIAARLGYLTNNRMVISATTDLDWLELDQDQNVSEHLFVIGRPDRNKVIPWLSKQVALPVSLREKKLALSLEGFTAIVPEKVFSYTITVTNTNNTPETQLSLIDQLPRQAKLVSCQPNCNVTDQTVVWPIDSLLPGKVFSALLQLQLVEDSSPLTPPITLENQVILVDNEQSPLNIAVVTTSVGAEPLSLQRVISRANGDYIFVQNGRPVADADGVLEQVISPRDPQKVIMLITGASNEGVYKASQSLGDKTGLPGMNGPFALIRKVIPPPPITPTWQPEFSFTDLNYSDQIIYGPFPYSRVVDYWFKVPVGWHFTNQAYVQLFLSHSQAINTNDSTLTVLLNNVPLATVSLDKTNAVDGNLTVPLPNTSLRRGKNNRISIQASMHLAHTQCTDIDEKQAWVNISKNSRIYLGSTIDNSPSIDLEYFPFPFDAQKDLTDVLFILPSIPNVVELEGLLNTAAVLGNGNIMMTPAVAFETKVSPQELNRYHIIIIGRPTRNTITQQINGVLPQPFIPGTDQIESRVGEVLLRFPPDTSMGYIQELPSPWNKQHTILALTGTTDEGITQAMYALTRQTWQLKGNLVLTHKIGDKLEIKPFNTQKLTESGLALALATAVPVLTPAATTTVTATPVPVNNTPSPSQPQNDIQILSETEFPTWVIMFVGTTGVTVLIMLGIAVWNLTKQSRQ